MNRILASVALLAFAGVALAQVKVGVVGTLPGPNASIGADTRGAFTLASKLSGGKVGGLQVELLVNDDQLKPENAKQIVERYLRLDKVDFDVYRQDAKFDKIRPT